MGRQYRGVGLPSPAEGRPKELRSIWAMQSFTSQITIAHSYVTSSPYCKASPCSASFVAATAALALAIIACRSSSSAPVSQGGGSPPGMLDDGRTGGWGTMLAGEAGSHASSSCGRSASIPGAAVVESSVAAIRARARASSAYMSSPPGSPAKAAATPPCSDWGGAGCSCCCSRPCCEAAATWGSWHCLCWCPACCWSCGCCTMTALSLRTAPWRWLSTAAQPSHSYANCSS